jgi:hypothetical protein
MDLDVAFYRKFSARDGLPIGFDRPLAIGPKIYLTAPRDP